MGATQAAAVSTLILIQCPSLIVGRDQPPPWPWTLFLRLWTIIWPPPSCDDPKDQKVETIQFSSFQWKANVNGYIKICLILNFGRQNCFFFQFPVCFSTQRQFYCFYKVWKLINNRSRNHVLHCVTKHNFTSCSKMRQKF